MKIKLLIIFTILFVNQLYPQFVWQELGFNYGGSVNAIIVLKNGHIIAGHSTGIFRSTNNGASFDRVLQTPMEVMSLAKNDSNGYVYAGINSYNNQYGGVYRSADEVNWSLIGINPKRGGALAVTSNGNVFVASWSSEVNMGGIWKSINNGNSWNNSLSALYDVYCLFNKNDTLFAGTRDIVSSGWGQLLRSVDYGVSWGSVGWYQAWGGVKGSLIDLLGNYYCVASGIIRRSSNTGTNWIDVYNGVEYYLNTPMVVNSLNHIFVGSSPGGTLRSTNNGLNWHSVGGYNTYSLFIDTLDNIYLGTNNRIYRSSTVSYINTISEKLPSSFSLSQNYPNPFNPTTKIRFDIPKQEFIILKIFDALGREVQTLVNEKLSQGTYETEWNASQYPSGIYFYRLESSDFKETKRMLLIK